MPRRPEFGRTIERANIEMRFGREPRAFTSQGRPAPGTKTALGPSRCRIELSHLTFGDGISWTFERYEHRSRCAAMPAATLAMAPIYSLRLAGRDKADRAAQAATFEFVGHLSHCRFFPDLLSAEIGCNVQAEANAGLPNYRPIQTVPDIS